ncbi:hypothetical protein MRB53_037841 [Persea americana]|nr:hypothetical protein MRB53_037841 [Persea americana]
MFALKSLSKYLFGDTSKNNIVELPQGQLFLVRPNSPKGFSELIFIDAAAYIRRTGKDFQYQLVIQRALQEGETELDEENEESSAVQVLGTDKDERVFLLDEEIRLRFDTRTVGDGEETVFAWKDLSGDPGDLYEFLIDSSTREDTISSFQLVAVQCQFERKYRRSFEQATDEQLQEFEFDDEPEIPQASPLPSPGSRTPLSSVPSVTRLLPSSISSRDMAPKAIEQTPTKAPAARTVPASREILANKEAELHLFDFNTGQFFKQDALVRATVIETGDWDYWLQITGTKREWLGQNVVPDINPVFNLEYLSFIFNHYTEDGSAYSWLLRFKDRESIDDFQHGLMQALWEHANKTKWAKAVKDADRDYVLDAFNDLVLEDTTRDDRREAEAREEDEEEDEFEDAVDDTRADYDDDEDEDEEDEFEQTGDINSQLAVGAKTDRSFVVRGNKIGVFTHTKDNQLKYSTTINDVKTPKGKNFSPKKVMLHSEDRDMVLQNANDPHSLFRMDLEYGKVVDEWKVDDNIAVNVFSPENKFAQMTGEQTFLGLSNNALFRIDPRLEGNKLVDSQLKQYVSKNDFSAAATTEKGYIAVASNKGDIRLFDRLGIQAKTALPALGDPIIGLDTSADGRWVLATTKTYLLLIDALQKDGKNEGKLGFEKAFAKDSKPQPRRLALTPSHVAQFQHETKAALSFTPARFNTGEGQDETTIITATGPFVVTWSLNKILKGQKDPYKIKRYGDEIKADNFRFGSDKNIVVALPNEVNMVARRALQRPTRESIMATPQKSKGRGSYLSRNDVVNSPY